MRIAFTADWHLRGKDFNHCRAQLLQFAEKVKEQNVDTIVIAGDIFETPNIVDQHASSGALIGLANEIMARLVECCEDIIIIRGNHDQSGAGSADALHVFDPYANAASPHVTIVRSRTVLNRTDVYLACLPWQWDIGLGAEHEIQGLIRHCQAENADRPIILTGHVGVGGARDNDGGNYEQKTGSWSIARSFLEGLRLLLIRIAFGHEHARQDLSGGHGGYVGAIRQCNFGEEGNPAGFEIYDTHSRSTEWIELDAAPTFRTVVVDPEDSADYDQYLEDDQNEMELIEPVEAGSENLRMQIMGGIVDNVAVRKLEQQGVVVEHFIEPEERVRRADVPTGILQDHHALIRLWAEQQEPPIPEDRLDRLFCLYDRVLADATQEETIKS